MSQPESKSTSPPTLSAPKEKTFSSYNASQGKAYAQIRRNYHPDVYRAILDLHTSTGGQLGTLLDIGCGPGTAAFSLSSHFAQTIGLDPSEGMIATARSALPDPPMTEHPIRFEISTAESLGQNLTPPIPNASIDLVTAANAAHWFDMAGFWPAAARVLKPGGSVVLWTSGEIRAHPDTPGAAGIQAAFDRAEEEHLKAFYEPGNLIVRGGYSDLPLPWTLEKPVGEFHKEDFVRKEWGVGEQFFVGLPEAGLDVFEVMMGTGSAVARWREANPEKVGTEADVVRIMRRDMERVLRAEGVKEGEEKIKGSVKGVVLLVKKRKE